MSLTALEIEKGAEKLQESFDKEILKLNEVKSKLLEDKNVQLFVFFNSRIQEEKLKKENAINEFINTNREECEHPLYVCVTSMNSSYSYKCICLNCGKTAYFKEYELNSLYNEHKLIALKKEESFLPIPERSWKQETGHRKKSSPARAGGRSAAPACVLQSCRSALSGGDRGGW